MQARLPLPGIFSPHSFLQPAPLRHLPPLPADYRDSGNTGAVLMIAPSLEFEFVCFPPAPRPDGALAAHATGAAAGQPAEPGQFSSPQPAAPLPDNAGVSLPVGPLATSPFAADADVPLTAAAPAAGEATPAAQTMQQVRPRVVARQPVWASCGFDVQLHGHTLLETRQRSICFMCPTRILAAITGGGGGARNHQKPRLG